MTVHPVVLSPSRDLRAERLVLSEPSMELVVSLLEPRLLHAADRHVVARLAAALAACAQLSHLSECPVTVYANVVIHPHSVLRAHGHLVPCLQCPASGCGLCRA